MLWKCVIWEKVQGRLRYEDQKCEEESCEVLIREGLEELMLRAEEVNTQKSCNNVDHFAQDRCGPPLVDVDWHAFCPAIYNKH